VTDSRSGDELDELRELELALEAEREQAAELRALDETKNTFIAAVSHDLRTPLAAILGLAVTLQKQSLDHDQINELAGRIATNARKLDRMVTDLLDLDRISRGMVAPDLRSVNLGKAVAGVVGESELIAGREVSVEVEDVVVQVDAAMVERIVENLLANAVRHTPLDSRIWVRVRSEAGGPVIIVEDEGPGVPPEQRQEIFEPFHQAAATDRTAGVGVGLALVARFAELHGGRAWVEDGQYGGASFHVWLPAQPPPNAARSGAPLSG
jgi:two-component system, OmpR family, sensor histidine kinase KdpD